MACALFHLYPRAAIGRNRPSNAHSTSNFPPHESRSRLQTVATQLPGKPTRAGACDMSGFPSASALRNDWQRGRPPYTQRRNNRLAFTPPKPKPLDSACSIGQRRASPRTRSRPSASVSGVSRLSVAGASWSRSARTVKIASMPPAAPGGGRWRIWSR